MGPALLLLLTLWLVVLFDPQWLVAAWGARAFLRLPTILFATLLLVLAIGVPTRPNWQSRWQWYLPLSLMMVAGALVIPFAQNNGWVRESLQAMLLQWALIVATVAFVGSARRAERLLLLFAGSFLWWGLWGARSGLVFWHPALANYDGFGAYMVIGVGLCSFIFPATENRKVRYLLIASVALGVVGVVASFARGAFLAAMAVFGIVWLRSNRKGPTLAAGVAAGLIVVAAASLLYPEQFWAEMQSVFTEGTDEGTGQDRWILWTAAVDVFLERPILGVGLRNAGVYASGIFESGELGGMYQYNVGRLYGRSLHSLYFTILAEQGIVGCLLFGWILVDFWKRNSDLKTPEAARRWAAMGGTLRLDLVATGLEVGMVGFLAVAAVYSVSGFQCYYSLLALNLLLHSIAFQGGAVPKRRRRATLSTPRSRWPGGVDPSAGRAASVGIGPLRSARQSVQR